VIQPPENATAPVSDEDSGDEEGGTISNMPGSLLRAPAYLIQAGYDAESDSDGPSYAPEDDSLDEVSSTSAAQATSSIKETESVKNCSQMEKKLT
jgi:hypothetical protein